MFGFYDVDKLLIITRYTKWIGMCFKVSLLFDFCLLYREVCFPLFKKSGIKAS